MSDKIKENWVAWEELLPGFTPSLTIDFQQIGGLAPGSIPFADASGFLTQDNAALFWDAGNDRLGIGIGAPVCREHIRGAACGAYAGIHPDTMLLLENDDNVALQLQCATTGEAYIVFADDDFNPPAGIIEYDFADDEMTFAVGGDDLVVIEADGADSRIYSFHKGIKIDSVTYAAFIADAHNADAYVEFQEDAALKWTVGFDFSDSLKFQISEGLPGTNVRFEIESGTLINLYLDVGIRNSQDLRFYDNGNYVGFKPPALAADQIWVLPAADGALGEHMVTDGAGNLTWTTGAGTGDVSAAANITDHAIVRGNGGAKGVQDSGILIDDADNVSGMGTLACGAITASGDILATSAVTRSLKATVTNTNAYAGCELNADTATWFIFSLGSVYGGVTFAGLTGNDQTGMEAQNASSFYIGTLVAAPIVFAQHRVEKARMDTSGNWGFGTASPGAKADVAYGGYQGVPALMIGADIGNNTSRTNVTSKWGMIAVPHYTNAEQEIFLISMYSVVADSVLYIGGGDSNWNAATEIRLYTAANNTTVTGTKRMEINSAGGIFMYSLKSGANQGAAGAAVNELWVDTGDQTIKLGV